ncbi:hypothetical protein [Amycolatopsis sp. WQ 127309]|uniref:hypothetical protein n=1 Tax=Amycolatopsis sp. WQ 127309 TaxID=2932773 RepID=UPI001FF1848C|nr:hypothetical protein [Amycolatopsis sp. WQ 127309]UOZ05555.1 hypothetical protein MUY22_43125 [Amycolatopsis sp. WQ 127309]
MTDHDPLAYEVTYSLRLNEIAATTAEVVLHPDEVRPIDIEVTGPCPACGGATVHIEPVEFVRGAASDGALDIEVICACAFSHEDAPDGKTGCGRSWRLTVEWDGA